jgi:hypothetical protein
MIALLLWMGVPCALPSFFPEDKAPLNSSKLNLKFNLQVIERFVDKAETLVEAQGGKLVVIPEWNNPRVNALASRQEHIWEIHVYGGLLSHPELSEDEVTLVLCHELGHHLGGKPTASRGGWSSSEGQSDYWSGQFCAHLLEKPEESAEKLARLYAETSAGSLPRLTEKDLKVVPRTFFGYPSAQCRLDTIIAGMKGWERPFCWYAPEK